MSEQGWLTELEQQAWRGWIDASRRIEMATDRHLKDTHALCLDDYEVLVRLSEAVDTRMRMSDLAACVTHSPSRLSQRIDRMADRGLVGREPSAADGRVALVCLTDAGAASLIAAAPDHVDEVRRLFVNRLTSEDIATLTTILAKLLAAS